MRRNDRKVNDQSEIEEIIKKADVCRLAMIDDNKPYLVTLNFGYQSGNPAYLYFHCANEGRKLDIIEKNNLVCFEMDVDHELTETKKACGYSMSFKSIVGYGKISKVKTNEEKIKGLDFIMKQYSDRTGFTYEDKMLEMTTILKLEIETLTCKVKK
jgi:nitroimidazol reductase NimA-like FMN-containing flavoprotein (pyridoxamine 5'-phosphate oxidase superfamily)